MDVLQLHQGIPGGVVRQIHPGIFGLQLFVAALGRGQGVVAVAHSKNQRTCPGRSWYFSRAGGGIGGQTVFKGRRLLTRDQVASNVAAALHEVKIVQLRQALLLGPDGLQQHLPVVVTQQQNMGQLQAGVPPDPLAGGIRSVTVRSVARTAEVEPGL